MVPDMKSSLASLKKLRADDLYQWMLMTSTHAQRHILQIREVRAHSGFPRK